MSQDAEAIGHVTERAVESDVDGKTVGDKEEVVGTIFPVKRDDPKAMLVLQLRSGLDDQFSNDLSCQVI